MSEKIEPFEFECNDDIMRYVVENDTPKRQRIYHNPSSGVLNWITEYAIDKRDIPGIRALLAERARRDGVFARLMEVARNCIHPANERSHDELDTIQREWDGETKRGEGK